MNDDKFLDEALKEHARHEGNVDQAFLDELETKLDEQSESHGEERTKRMKKSSSKVAWMSVAALVMVGVTAIALLEVSDDKAPQIASEPIVTTGGSAYIVAIAEPVSAPEAEATDLRLGATWSTRGDGLLDSMESDTQESEKRSKLVATSPKNTVAPSSAMSTPVPASTGMIVDRLDLSRADGFGEGGGGSTVFGRPAGEQHSGNKYGQLIDQGFLSPLQAPLSTFSIDVDTASYTNIRKLIETGRAIDPNAVRIEEMVNYFDYSYGVPDGDHPFAVHTEVAGCPWNVDHRLVKIGLKGKEVHEQRKAANLVFLIDVSGSMNSADKLPLLVQSFDLLLNSLNENDRVSLVVYAGRQAVLLRPTALDADGRQVARNALKKLSAGGSTNGAAGISTAYDLARSGFIEGGVNRVILATDGDFNVGTTNQAELLKLVENQAEGQISLTILGFGQGNLNDNLMEQLTNHGDGNYFYLDSLKEAQKVFQEKLTGTIETIAKDVKIQVEFNPGKIASYRLIGYANRRLKDEDFANDKVDAGDIGAGHTVTALYEVVPVGVGNVKVPDGLKYQKIEEAETPRKIVDSPELLTVKLRYKQPEGKESTELSQSLTDEKSTWQDASDDFRFASSVALWGMVLRSSEYAGDGDAALVSELAMGARGEDTKGERAAFLDLVRKWKR